jgi:hypothetical protein
MRIISQNGRFDVPYESGELICESNIVLFNGSSRIPRCVAEYSSPEKVQKAMEMLHMGYVGLMPSLIISDCGISPADLEELKQSSMDGGQIMVSSQSHGRIEYHMLPRIFRFPADDEIEVE